MNHVIFAAGRLGPNEQLALILSPTSYRDLANSINGMFVVNSVQEKKTKRRKRVSRWYVGRQNTKKRAEIKISKGYNRMEGHKMLKRKGSKNNWENYYYYSFWKIQLCTQKSSSYRNTIIHTLEYKYKCHPALIYTRKNYFH